MYGPVSTVTERDAVAVVRLGRGLSLTLETLAAREDVEVVAILAATGRLSADGDDADGVARAIDALDAPVVVAVGGAVAGPGLALVCAADIVVAARSATFTAGGPPVGGASWLLPRLIGLRRATELMLTDRVVSAGEARDIGLVTSVVADDQLETALEASARQLRRRPRASQAATRDLLRSSASSLLDEQIDFEALHAPPR